LTILTHFPHDTYRQFQKPTILTMEKAYNDGSKYIILEAPCGSGKSPMAITMGMHFAPSYLLTSQKVLQTQYVHDYGSPDFAELMGRSNYPCEQMEDSTCDDGFCTVGRCPDPSSCPYETAKKIALNSKIALMNYTYFLYATYYAKIFPPVNMIIYDEAHGVDKELMNFVEIKFTSKYLRKLGSISDIPDYEKVEDYHSWLKQLSELFAGEVVSNESAIGELKIKFQNANSGGDTIIESIKRLHNINTRLETQILKIKKFFETSNENEWIHDLKRDKNNSDHDQIFFKPVTVAPYAKELLFNYGDKHMLMSATILDKVNFCKNLGIPEGEAVFYRVPSTFPPDGRKIFFINTGSMSYTNIEETLPFITKDISDIMDVHKDHKGLIYTHSFKISRYINDKIEPKYKSRLIGHDGGDRGQALSYFITHKQPKVMISPSLSEGIDLKDDLARFIIVAKIPFAFLGDPQIKRRKEIDPGWYVWKAALTLVQVTGRGVRHKDDWCHIYILDSAFRGFLIRNKRFFPRYFIDAIQE